MSFPFSFLARSSIRWERAWVKLKGHPNFLLEVRERDIPNREAGCSYLCLTMLPIMLGDISVAASRRRLAPEAPM